MESKRMWQVAISIAKAEMTLFRTRTLVQEICHWIRILVLGTTLTVYLFKQDNFDFRGQTYYRKDVLKDRNYSHCALITAITYLVEVLEISALILHKNVGRDSIYTHFFNLSFWTIATAYAMIFDNTSPCEERKNLFPCVYNTEILPGRWSGFWIIALIKLILDAIFWVWHRHIMEHKVSILHGQALSGLVLDVQYLLVALWINGKFATNSYDKIMKDGEYYSPIILFMPVFISLMIAPILAVGSLFLIYFTLNIGEKLQAIGWLVFAMLASVSFVFAFAFDATAGERSTQYAKLTRALILIMLILTLIFSAIRIYIKYTVRSIIYGSLLSGIVPDNSRECPILLASKQVSSKSKPTTVAPIISDALQPANQPPISNQPQANLESGPIAPSDIRPSSPTNNHPPL